jgi:hypothetical protein
MLKFGGVHSPTSGQLTKSAVVPFHDGRCELRDGLVQLMQPRVALDGDDVECVTQYVKII